MPRSEGDEIAPKENQVGSRSDESRTGRLDRSWWGEWPGVKVCRDGKSEPAGTAEWLGQVDLLPPDAEGGVEKLSGQGSGPGIAEELVLQVLRGPTPPGEVAGQRAC
jgi:hypothetical protein